MLKLPVISLRRLLQIISWELKAATTATSTKTSLENAHLGNGNYLVIIGLLQQTITWYMVAGKLIVIPALGHQNKGKSSFTGSGLFVLMSHSGSNNELALQHVPCDRKFRNFTLSFGRLRQRILRKCVPHMQHDYFSPFNQSDHCFMTSSVLLTSSLLKVMLHEPIFNATLLC